MADVIRWKHIKTDHEYDIMSHGVIENTLVPVVIYCRCDGTGPTWVRPASEFFDGRFIQVMVQF